MFADGQTLKAHRIKEQQQMSVLHLIWQVSLLMRQLTPRLRTFRTFPRGHIKTPINMVSWPMGRGSTYLGHLATKQLNQYKAKVDIRGQARRVKCVPLKPKECKWSHKVRALRTIQQFSSFCAKLIEKKCVCTATKNNRKWGKCRQQKLQDLLLKYSHYIAKK